MNNELLNELTFFVLAVFVGFEVISKVPTILHTPLMSGTNAIHGIILVGAVLIAAGADSPLNIALGLVAVTSEKSLRCRPHYVNRWEAAQPPNGGNTERAEAACCST